MKIHQMPLEIKWEILKYLVLNDALEFCNAICINAVSAYQYHNFDAQDFSTLNSPVHFNALRKNKRFLNQLNSEIIIYDHVCRFGYINVLKEILLIYNPSVGDNIPIFVAAENGQLEILKELLLDSRVDPSAKSNRAFRAACAHGHLAVVLELLKDSRVDPSDVDNSAIQSSCEKGFVQIFQELLKDARVDPSDSDNMPIKLCCEFGHLTILKELIKDSRVDPAVDDNLPFQLACKNGHLEICKELLLDSRVDPSSNENDALLAACENDEIEIVELLLLDSRVDPSSQDNLAVQIAAEFGNLEVLKRLLQDSRVDPSDDDNEAVKLACKNGHLEILKELLNDPRVDPSADNNYALDRSIRYGYKKIRDFLLLDDRVRQVTRQNLRKMTKNIVETFPSVEEENNSMITSSTSPDEKLSLIVNGTDESCSSFPSTKELQHTIAEDSIPQDDNSESVLEESSVSAKLDSGSYPSYSAQKSSSPTAVEAPPFTIDKSVLPQNPVSQNPVSVPQKSDLSGVYSFHPEHAVTFTTTDEMLMSLPLGSRLFLGRLATEKTDRNELASIFAKYGPIHEISLKNTFGFIQFATAEACQAAILHEQGRVIGGLSVDLNVSKDRPRKGQAGSDQRKEQQRRGTRDFDRNSDRRDNRSRPYSRKVSRSRSPSPYRRDRDRGRYSRYDDPRDSRRSNDSDPLPRRYGNVPLVQIVILGDVERNYLSQVENAFGRSGLGFDTMHLGPRMNLGAAVAQLKSEGVKAIVFLNKQLERSGRVAMQHFKSNGKVQEYESILPDAAIEIYNRESKEDGAGLASMIAGLASAAQSQGQMLDPNTIAALASIAQGGQAQNPQQAMYGGVPKMGGAFPNYQMGQMPPVSQAVNPNLAAILSSLGGPQQNYPMMGYSQAPPYPTSGYRSAVPVMSNKPMNMQMPAQAQPVSSAPKSDSVADILSKLKNLADMQKR